MGRKSRRKRESRPQWITSIEPPRRRSLVEPLMWVGAVALIGFPMLRDATADRMVRNEYRDRASCECDYGRGRCSWNGTRFVGPWYAGAGTKPAADDPGTGACYARHGSSYVYGGGASGSSDYRPPSGVEHGYRGGFGGSGRVRAAGS